MVFNDNVKSPGQRLVWTLGIKFGIVGPTHRPGRVTTMSTTETTTIRELNVGDVVWSWGMKLLVDNAPHRTLHPLDAGGETWATNTQVLDNAGLVTCTRWTLQGNDRGTVDREVSA
jgi:hypothetical protein